MRSLIQQLILLRRIETKFEKIALNPNPTNLFGGRLFTVVHSPTDPAPATETKQKNPTTPEDSQKHMVGNTHFLNWDNPAEVLGGYSCASIDQLTR